MNVDHGNDLHVVRMLSLPCTIMKSTYRSTLILTYHVLKSIISRLGADRSELSFTITSIHYIAVLACRSDEGC